MESEKRSYCRLCADLTPNSKLFNLLSDSERSGEIVEKLIRLRHEFINIFRDQILPKTVCFLCLDAVYRSAAFIEKVEKSQMALKSLLCTNNINKEQSWMDKNNSLTDSYEMRGNIKPENFLLMADHTNRLINEKEHNTITQNPVSLQQPNVPILDRDLYQKDRGQDLQNLEQSSNNPELQYVPKNATKIVKRKKKPQPLPIRQTNKIVDKTWTGYPWTCDICYAGFSDVCTLREHTKRFHWKCFAMKCVDCLDTADCYISFVYHVRSHRSFLKDFCPYCNCNYKSNQKEHIALHFSGPEKMCDCCGQIFMNADELQNHIATYQPPKPKRLASIARLRPTIIDDKTCEICNKVFTTAGSARAHKQIHSERKKDHICEVCGKDFFRKSDLSHHRLIHGTSDQVCKICKKTFATLQRLRNHVLTHSAEKPFQCYICKRNFRLKRQMKDHMITHTNERPYKCDYCDKCFRFKNTWKSHQLQHTGEKPFTCQNCGRDFANWSNCNQHMKTKHGMTLAKHVVTPQGKVPVNPMTGRLKKVKPLEAVKEWTEQILETRKRKKKADVN